LLCLLLAGCGEKNSAYAGLSKGEATRTVHSQVKRLSPVRTFPYDDDAVRTTMPGGQDAWLVRVVYEGDSGDVCMYIWRDSHRKRHLVLDSGCFHWKYD
jgi:hypothetical protein